MNKLIYIIIGLVVIVGALFFISSPDQKSDGLGEVSEVSVFGGSQESISEDSYLYKSDTYNFSLVYPKELVIKEYDEGGGSHTITFEIPGEPLGFQIFTTPYFEDYITEEQLKKDIRSGIIRKPTEVFIGKEQNIRALIFETESSVIGETREVWFIQEGRLYEISTYLDLDEWISEILSTFEFN